MEDAPRQGRPATYSPEERAEVVAALHRPRELNLPFGCWSLDRLTPTCTSIRRSPSNAAAWARSSWKKGLRWRKEETWFGAERVDPDFAKKKGDHRATLHRTAGRQRGALPGRNGPRVGPELPRRGTAPGPGQPAGRARQEVDYGRRGKGYIFGAFEPQDGRAFTLPYPGRTTANGVDFLQAVDAWVGPEPKAVFAIVDNLSTHRAADVLLFSLANPRWHFVFQPTYAAYLNLIEPW